MVAGHCSLQQVSRSNYVWSRDFFTGLNPIAVKLILLQEIEFRYWFISRYNNGKILETSRGF